ncbi:MAG: hypothetical protein HWE22_17110 [Flavobacteriales bacterium]|nr:hypothetical protein [Flavobacteriales bacterium]
MKLKKRGTYLELPLSGLCIKEIVYDGLLRLVFNDREKSYLDLHNDFFVDQYNQETKLHPKQKESLIFFYNQFGEEVKEALADTKGNLWITFINGTKITVQDGPHENWHYTKRNLNNKSDSLFVHGGVGTTTH